MSKHRVLCLKPHLRLEWRGEEAHNETDQPNHFANLDDSITASTRIRFSVYTTCFHCCAQLLKRGSIQIFAALPVVDVFFDESQVLSTLQISPDDYPQIGAISVRDLIANPDADDHWTAGKFKNFDAAIEHDSTGETYEVPIGNRTIRIKYSTSTLDSHYVSLADAMLRGITITTTTESLDHYKDQAQDCAK